ncbi:hypothetical protein WN944_005382 [Citrus x changshan-huyou]|uniref:GDSL esterase/lipase 7-like n=1 Tax=Citrus x changshan-huyou TaxID=2935761 RepID=A0AAP0M665_9ROSI
MRITESTLLRFTIKKFEGEWLDDCGSKQQKISSTNGTSPLAPALYVLGDSLLDSGNNNYLQTIIKANYSPYGEDFVNKCTGRFSNGKTVADFIAEFLGLPYAPPFLSFKPRDKLPLTGLNYASGACGILRDTGHHLGDLLSLEEQVGLFQDTLVRLQGRNFKSSKELSEYLSKSIFIISIGSNDYISNYPATLLHDTNKRFARLLTSKLSHQLQRLYNLGARKIVVSEIGPIGCVPAITSQNKHKGKCVEHKNQLVSEYNSMLPAMLQNLTSSLQGSSFVNGHAYRLASDAIINPSNYGLKDASNPCCKTWLSGIEGCIPFVEPCDRRDKYYFWDGYHPSEIVYSLFASRCINNASFCSPFSLKELVKM